MPKVPNVCEKSTTIRRLTDKTSSVKANIVYEDECSLPNFMTAFVAAETGSVEHLAAPEHYPFARERLLTASTVRKNLPLASCPPPDACCCPFLQRSRMLHQGGRAMSLLVPEVLPAAVRVRPFESPLCVIRDHTRVFLDCFFSTVLRSGTRSSKVNSSTAEAASSHCLSNSRLRP